MPFHIHKNMYALAFHEFHFLAKRFQMWNRGDNVFEYVYGIRSRGGISIHKPDRRGREGRGYLPKLRGILSHSALAPRALLVPHPSLLHLCAR